MPLTTLAAGEVAYMRAGKGPPLILLHGFLADSRIWRPQIESLADEFTVLAWDAPGAGRSFDPPDRFEMADWADCLEELLNAQTIDRAHMLGLSWGGVLAQELYRRYPARVRSLILADTYAGWRGSLSASDCDERLRTCLEDSALPGNELASKWLAGLLAPRADPAAGDELAAIISDFHPHGFRLMARSLADTDHRDLLPQIEAPTLLIWGEEDARSPLDVAEQLHAAIPGSRLVVIPDAGHVSNLERPGRFNEALRSFLAELE